jgi:hypothetical protein
MTKVYPGVVPEPYLSFDYRNMPGLHQDRQKGSKTLPPLDVVLHEVGKLSPENIYL